MPGPGPTNFLPPFTVGGIPTQGIAGAPLFTGNWFFVDAANGSDGNTGAANQPLATVYRAFSKCTAGNNDVVVIVGNGAASGSQRLSLANAQLTDSTVTAGTLVWNKNATHMIGMTAPTQISARARFAPPTGTYTQATFGSGNFVTVSGSGCYFANFSLFNGFSTGGSNQICWTDTGGRNYYGNVHFGGAADTASAQSTSSRSFLLSTVGECTFVGCTFGVDTVTRTVANATFEFGAGATRNIFRNCDFAMLSSASTAVHVKAGAATIDRYTLFDNCCFSNAVDSTGVALDAAFSVDAAAGGACILNNSISYGATAIATAGPVYINQISAAGATTTGIAIKAT